VRISRTQRLLRRAVRDTFAAMGWFAGARLDAAPAKAGRRRGVGSARSTEPGTSCRG
jgi:hypothetical protein